MRMELDVHPVLLRPAEGEGEAIVDTPNRELRILCDHEWLNATWTRHAAGERGAEPHIHLHHVDAFYVLAGEMTLRSGPSSSSSPPAAGTLVLVPPGLVHGFDNDSDGEVRFLNFHAPGCGFVEYLRGRGEFDQAPPPEDGGRPASDAIVAPPGGGERFQREDRAVTILGDLPEISVLLLEVEPEWPGIPAHAHDDQVDSLLRPRRPLRSSSAATRSCRRRRGRSTRPAGRAARLPQLRPAGPAERARPGRRVRRGVRSQ